MNEHRLLLFLSKYGFSSCFRSPQRSNALISAGRVEAALALDTLVRREQTLVDV